MARSYQNIFKALSEEGAAFLVRHGEDRNTSEIGGCKFAERVMNQLAKQAIYFPTAKRELSKKKSIAIKEEFDQSYESVKTLAQRHEITVVQAYNILKATQGIKIPPKTQGHEAILVISIEAARMLIKHGVPAADAAGAARGFAAIFCARWGGRIIYFPVDGYAMARKRHQQMWTQYQEGVPITNIAERYGISTVAVRLAIRKLTEENGGETPRVKSQNMALGELQRRILKVAEPYIDGNGEIYSLLESAAEYVAKAREVVK